MFLSKIAKKTLSPLITSRMIFNSIRQKSLFVFNYHEVSNSPSRFSNDCGLNVKPDLFRKQLLWIKNNFHVISPEDLLKYEFDYPAALITFDDGFASTFREGAPILREMNLPGIVFMNMAPLEGHIFWSGLVVYLCKYNKDFIRYITIKYPYVKENLFLHCTESDVKDFVKENNCQNIYEEARSYYGKFATTVDLEKSSLSGLYLGNHLYNHFNAANISLHDLERQYLLNEEALMKYSNYINFFSYPFGSPNCYNKDTDELIASLGARRIFSAYPLANTKGSAKKIHRVSPTSLIIDETSFKYNCVFSSLINCTFRKWKYSYV